MKHISSVFPQNKQAFKENDWEYCLYSTIVHSSQPQHQKPTAAEHALELWIWLKNGLTWRETCWQYCRPLFQWWPAIPVAQIWSSAPRRSLHQSALRSEAASLSIKRKGFTQFWCCWIAGILWINYTDKHLERFTSGLTHHWSQDDADAQDFAEYTFQTRN